jgi:hypothetical protein
MLQSNQITTLAVPKLFVYPCLCGKKCRVTSLSKPIRYSLELFARGVTPQFLPRHPTYPRVPSCVVQIRRTARSLVRAPANKSRIYPIEGKSVNQALPLWRSEGLRPRMLFPSQLCFLAGGYHRCRNPCSFFYLKKIETYLMSRGGTCTVK